MDNFNVKVSNRYKSNNRHNFNMERLDYLKLAVVLTTIAIIFRLFQLQVVSYAFYNDLAVNQYNNLSTITAKRGEIYLKNHKTNEMVPIATNRTMDMVYADPNVIENKEETSRLIAPILEMKEKEVFEKINKKYRDYVKLVINPDPVTILQIRKYDLPGIYIKTAYDFKLEEFAYEDEVVKEAMLEGISTSEKEQLKSKIEEISADPTKIGDLKNTVQILTKILPNYTEKDLTSILIKKEQRYVPLKRKLSLEQSDKIKALNIYGIVLWPEEWRFYPEQNLASQILGFVDQQGIGRYGIEGQFDDVLKGKDGQRKVDTDIKGNPIVVGDAEVIEDVVNGSNFVLTIDRSIQQYAEEKLKKIVDQSLAKSGQVLIMDPKTGQIIAMANYPDFDPNNFSKVYEKDPATEKFVNKIGPKVFINNTLASAYEFGSTFKIITVSTALDSGEMNTTDTVCDKTGEVVIDNFVMKNSDLKAHQCMTLGGVLEKSSNIGALRVGLKVGSGVLRKYAIDFGFGEYTDIGFNDENNGYLGPPREWGRVKTANASFGQGITGSPLQLVRAISVIANQGKLVQPYLIDEITGPDNTIKKTQPIETRRVITPSTAAKVTKMLIDSVEKGVAKPARLARWMVAAKTGTAQVAIAGGYSKELYVASIAGFAPASNPKFVMLVKIDHPLTDKWGSTNAAPLFKDIAEYMLNYYEIPYDR